jgi:sec-independent protein translocase protein TatB
MFGVDTTELLIVAVLALLFIGPKELPAAMRTVGRWVGKVRGMARQFTSGFEDVVREAELEEMEKKWRAENERIMREYPALPEAVVEAASDPADTDEPPLPLPFPEVKRELP